MDNDNTTDTTATPEVNVRTQIANTVLDFVANMGRISVQTTYLRGVYTVAQSSGDEFTLPAEVIDTSFFNALHDYTFRHSKSSSFYDWSLLTYALATEKAISGKLCAEDYQTALAYDGAIPSYFCGLTGINTCDYLRAIANKFAAYVNDCNAQAASTAAPVDASADSTVVANATVATEGGFVDASVDADPVIQGPAIIEDVDFVGQNTDETQTA